MVAQNECNDEEGDTQEYGHTGDQVDEMVDFLCNRGFASVQTGGQASNTSHNSVIAAADDNALSSSFNSVCWEEGQVLGFQWIVVGEFGITRLWFGFTSEWWIVDLMKSDQRSIRIFVIVNVTYSDGFSSCQLTKLTLKFLASIIRISAGILSPNLTSTTSPRTKSSARNVSFSPSRMTVANCGTMFLNDSIIFELFDS